MKFICVVSLICANLCLVYAQTDYDIQVFIDNLEKESPRIEELQFYLNAADRLLLNGENEKADIFYDFAACLGSVEGFKGKAAANTNPEKQYYHGFVVGNNPSANALFNALEHARDDLSSALLVHDNMDAYKLRFLRDPLLSWMPKTPADTLFLQNNDHITYMIAKLKEDAGNRLDALLIYEIAAWEGNYEALCKAQIIGTAIERKQKEALIGRMNNEEPFVLLHKYFAGSPFHASDFTVFRWLFTTPDERLLAYALSLSNGVLSGIGERRFDNKELFVFKLQDNKQVSKTEFGYALQDLKRTISDNRNVTYSKEIIDFIRNCYATINQPWTEQFGQILKDVPVDPAKKFTKKNNLYYPLFEKGLFSKLHHSKAYIPTRIMTEP